jgi:hypothetical protein
MQIISAIKQTAIASICSAICLAVPAYAAEQRLSFDAGTGESTCIRSLDDKYTKFSPCETKAGVIKADDRTSRILRPSDEIIPLLSTGSGNSRHLLMLLRTPSTQKRSTGFCGAGHEDSLILVELSGQRMIFKDRLLIQSCVKSLALESDDPDAPADALAIDKSAGALTFRWLGDAEGSSRLVKVAGGSLKLARVEGK